MYMQEKLLTLSSAGFRSLQCSCSLLSQHCIEQAFAAYIEQAFAAHIETFPANIYICTYMHTHGSCTACTHTHCTCQETSDILNASIHMWRDMTTFKNVKRS